MCWATNYNQSMVAETGARDQTSTPESYLYVAAISRRNHLTTPATPLMVEARRAVDQFVVLMPSTPFASPQVVSRPFTLFRVPGISVSAGQLDLWAEFDSRQLHREYAGQDHESWPALISDQHFIRFGAICRPHGIAAGDIPQGRHRVCPGARPACLEANLDVLRGTHSRRTPQVAASSQFRVVYLTAFR